MTGIGCEFGTPLLHHHQPAVIMPRPRQPDPSPPPPVWICPTCQKLMRVRAIEVANGQEWIKLACAACGAEAAQANVLSE